MRKKHIIILAVFAIALVGACLGLKQLDKVDPPVDSTPVVEEDQNVKEVIALIEKIKSPITLDSETEVLAAKAAYDNLTEAQKQQVTNADALAKAIADLEVLKQQKQQEDEKKNEPVDTVINVNDIVNFKGGKVYYTPYDEKAKVTRPAGKCKVYYLALNKAHPYCIVSIDTGKVWGWVDADTVEKEK